MRKDAKVLFAVGGLLLAVLVVYFVSTSKKKTAAGPVAVNTTPVNTTPGDGTPVVPVPPTSALPDPVTVPPTAPVIDNTPQMSATPAGGVEHPAIPGEMRMAPSPTEEKLMTDSHRGERSVERLAEKPVDAAVKPRGNETVYVVKSGENFSTISLAHYGTSRHWKEIQEANPKADSRKLHVGDKLNLPELAVVKPDPDMVPGSPNVIPLEEQQSAVLISTDTGTTTVGVGAVPAAAAAGPGPAPVVGQAYTVRQGDSLYKISKRVYKTGNRADAIYDANKAVIGPDRARLKLGMKLMIPDVPAAAAHT